MKLPNMKSTCKFYNSTTILLSRATHQILELLVNSPVVLIVLHIWFKNCKAINKVNVALLLKFEHVSLNDFSSMKLSSGAFQMGPLRKATKESKTQEFSSSIANGK